MKNIGVGIWVGSYTNSELYFESSQLYFESSQLSSEGDCREHLGHPL